MPYRIHVYMLIDPTPAETIEQAEERILTREGWMDGVLAWEHYSPGMPQRDHIAIQPTGDPGDDWVTRDADPNPTGGRS